MTRQSKRVKLLSPSDVPESVRKAYNFSSQRLERIGGYSRITIIRQCLRCGSLTRVRACRVREGCRNGNLTGLCKHCMIVKRNIEMFSRRNGQAGRYCKGYFMVRQPEHPYAVNGYVLQHRLVMEQTLGRLLLPSETVHHKNGIKDDNRPENLELWLGQHGPGQRYEDLSNKQIKILISHLRGLLAQRRASCPK